MNYRLYLFDFDYTLADSEKGIVMCFQHVFAQSGFLEISDKRIKETIGLTLEEAFSLLTGVEDPSWIATMRKEYVKKSDMVMVKNTKIFPGVIETLERLKVKGAQVGIISTKYRYRIEETIRQYKMEHLIDHIIGGEDVAVAKPNPEGVNKAKIYFGIPQKEMLYIGDSLVDAHTAENAGVDFAAVTTGMTTCADFRNTAHVKVMKTLGELVE